MQIHHSQRACEQPEDDTTEPVPLGAYRIYCLSRGSYIAVPLHFSAFKKEIESIT